MKALRFYGKRDIRLEEIPKPIPKEEEVLLKVTDAGISQTQINEFMDGPFLINSEPHPLTGKKIPIVPSQEYGGIIVADHLGSKNDPVGKMAAVLPLISCGRCEYCEQKKENLCQNLAYRGLLGADGGFCEFSAVKRENLFFTQKRELLTFIEPLAVAVHAAKTVKKLIDLRNSEVLILGAGAVGISVAAYFEQIEGAKVYISEILSTRKAKAKEAGFETLAKKEIKKSFDLVVDAAGTDPITQKPAITEGFAYLKRGAPLLNLGSYFHPVSFVPAYILVNENSLIESMAYDSEDIEKLKREIDNIKTDFSIFIERIPLKDIVNKGYLRAEVAKESFTRLVVEP